VFDYLGLIRSTLISQMLVASGVNDGHRVAALAGRSIEVLREIGRLTGELSKIGSAISTTNNIAILNDPKFIELQAGLLAIARSHPDARADIVALLRTLDSRPVPSRPNGAHPQMIEGPPARYG
jgi:tRNA A-37 threonylcarbamoyl transferase component Bud32